MWYNIYGDYMSVLVLNGSSRKNGNISKFVKVLENNVDKLEVIHTCDLKRIEFCRACDYCKNNIGCVLNDDVANILEKIINARALIIATPIYFESFPASLKLLIDRMQPLYYNVEKNIYNLKSKKCYTIVTAGMDRKGQFDHISKIINVIYRQLNGTNEYEILVANTDNKDVDIDNYKKDIERIINNIKEV